jgi:hypothetical protein
MPKRERLAGRVHSMEVRLMIGHTAVSAAAVGHSI